jgi:SAM-dependent methyltransferase
VHPDHLQDLIALEESYWWHLAKRRLVVDLLRELAPPPGRLVEGGIGSARNLVEFEQLGYRVIGLDTLAPAVAYARGRGLADVYQHDLAKPWPVDPRSVRAVVLLDVLEHSEDPIAVLRNARDVLEPEGVVVVTVPAYPSLYGDWDKMLGHHRRYTRKALRSQACAAELNVRRVTSWNSFALPAALPVRAIQRFKKGQGGSEFPRVSPLVNGVLLRCAGAERWWLKRAGVPFGLSIVGVLTR